jgi:branched-chain amino acid transport system ATP-binding protein
MAAPILSVHNLKKKFEGVTAVDGLTLDFSPDEIHAIIGPNGAGKTTTFNLITGDLPPTDGTVEFKGDDITAESAHEISGRGLVRSFQITSVFENLPVLTNVNIATQSNYNPYNFWRRADSNQEVRERSMEILERLNLADKADSLAANLSHGEQRVLEIALALGTDPDMLLFDEPTAGMSPEETMEMIDLINQLGESIPVALTEHKMSVVMSVADRITVLHNGRRLVSGPPDEVRQDGEVQRVYLGGTRT